MWGRVWPLLVALVAAADQLPGSREEHQCVHADYIVFQKNHANIAYTCNKGQYKMAGVMDDFVNIECQYNKIECSTFPRMAFSSNSTLGRMVLRGCAYDEPISCLLRKMNATRVDVLELAYSLSPLIKEHVKGLETLTKLVLHNIGGQTSIPYEAISSLPNLKEFHLRLTPLKLAARPFQAPQLRYILLYGNAIEELPPGVFEGLPNLEHLDLSSNKITTLQDDVFRGLGKLRTLIISNDMASPVISWSAGALSSLTSLKHLEIFTTHVPDGVLQALPHLEDVVITSPDLLQVDVSAFSNLTHLRKLDLGNNDLRGLPTAVFHGTKLNELSLSTNNLEKLHADLFKGQTEMRILDLSENSLKYIRAEVFLSLEKLVELDLRGNEIQVLDDYSFSPLRNLKILGVSFNKLKHIQELAFHGLPLRILELDGNQLSFHSDPFTGLTNLKELQLKNNNIASMLSSWQVNLTNLTKLDLSYNRFTKLKGSDFFSNNTNLTVDLQHNRISSITLDPMLRTKSTFILGSNPFNCDCHMYFFMKAVSSASNILLDGIKCASPLRLNGVYINQVPYDMFECEEENCASGCKCMFQPENNIVHALCSDLINQQSALSKAVALKLTYAPNSLKLLPFDNVSEIDLSGLNLTDISYDQFPKTVKFVDFSNNNLEYFPSHLLNLDMKFALRNNSFACDCKYYAHVANLVQNEHKILDFDQVACDSGTLLADAKRLCEVSLATYIGIFLAVFGVFCVLIATVVYKYSFEMKVIVAKYLPCLLPEEIYDASKKYDVFISYAHKDEDFIRDELLVRLEGPPNYMRACVHHRDWLVGETIPYNIAKSVVESRRTLIVLSEHFLDSIWGLMEFRVAHTQAAKEGRARVIIIILEDVMKRPEINQEISAYLHTNTYIKWGEPWFWEKLFYALPRRGKVMDGGEEGHIRAVANKLVVSRTR